MEANRRNVKLFPKYRQISRDFLFFYTINVLFLTQIKHIDMSSVVLVDTFYALFVVLVQVPAAFIVEKIGRKRGMVLGNLCNAIYLILVMNSNTLLHLICAELACSLGFSLKDIAEPAILNGSIELEKKEKSKKFAVIQGKAMSGYYVLSALSLIISGFLFEINGYIPMILSFAIVVIALIMSTRFTEPLEINEDEKKEDKKEVSLKEAIKFSFKSKRCRCLLIFSGFFFAIISVLCTYEISLIEDLQIDSKYIGIIFAVLNIISAFASKRQDKFQEKFKNRTLTILGNLLVFAIMIAGVASLADLSLHMTLLIIIAMYIVKYVVVGIYNVLLIKYLSNFTNSQIDTKIFAINSFISSITSALLGVFASWLITQVSIAAAMIILGAMSFVLLLIILIYMKDKFGLEPEQYSDLELKYDARV